MYHRRRFTPNRNLQGAAAMEPENDHELFEAACAAEQDSALNQEMRDWDVTLMDGLE